MQSHAAAVAIYARLGESYSTYVSRDSGRTRGIRVTGSDSVTRRNIILYIVVVRRIRRTLPLMRRRAWIRRSGRCTVRPRNSRANCGVGFSGLNNCPTRYSSSTLRAAAHIRDPRAVRAVCIVLHAASRRGFTASHERVILYIIMRTCE